MQYRSKSNIPAVLIAATLQGVFTWFRFSPKIKALKATLARVYAEELDKQKKETGVTN